LIVESIIPEKETCDAAAGDLPKKQVKKKSDQQLNDFTDVETSSHSGSVKVCTIFLFFIDKQICFCFAPFQLNCSRSASCKYAY
jgi:hypothetical protein